MEYILAAMLGGVALFQVLLALGLPYGAAAWGGQCKGVLTKKLRIGSALSAVFLLISASVALSKSDSFDFYSNGFVTGYLWFITIYSALGIVMNAASRSKIERIWAPYNAVMFLLGLLILT